MISTTKLFLKDTASMIFPVLTYSRNLGDFSHDLIELHKLGLRAIRLIYKGKSEAEFNLRIQEIQELITTNAINLDIWIDLPGSKPLVGNVQEGMDIKSGLNYFLVDQNAELCSQSIPTEGFLNQENFSNLIPGDIISIADDELNLEVKNVQKTMLTCEALNTFHLTSNRSISVKYKPFAMRANSERDLLMIQNLKHTQNNIKIVVSFAKQDADILRIKALQPAVEVIPKIETILDDAALLGIMQYCDTILLGRGDLSIASKPNELYNFQKRLMDRCKEQNKELIVGTGLLASLSNKQGPTISEVMDYSHLRNNGIDGFLIAGSNAHNYPFETLDFMKTFEVKA